MKFDDQSKIVIGPGGTPLYYPAGKMKIGIRHVNARAESMMTKSELDIQDIVLHPKFREPVKPRLITRLRRLTKRALDRFQLLTA